MPPSRALIVSKAGVGVQRAAQQRLEFRLVEQFLQPLGGGGHLGRQVLVFDGHLDQGRQVVAQLDDLLQRLGDRLEPFQFGDDFLGPLAVVPEIGPGHLLFELAGLGLLGGEVKESPAVARSASGWPRPDQSILVP